MKHVRFMTRAMVLGSFMVLPLILPIGSSAGEPMKGTRALQNEALKADAVESVRDTLKSCLGRIPADASIGQHMLAKENCQTVAEDRAETSLTF